MKKILIIDESPLFRNYLKEKLEGFDFEIVEGKNGLDGGVKMRNELPDLVIMDYYLSRRSSLQVLQEKKNNPNISAVPVVMVSNKIDTSRVVEIANYNVKKFFSKPLKLDLLLKTLSELLGMELKIDDTPCILEAHFNENILFIEIARGLNIEKIELLKYKLKELLELYKVKIPKVLLMLSDIDLKEKDFTKLIKLFDIIIDNGNTLPEYINVLTNSEVFNDFILSNISYKKINVSDTLEKAMDNLLGIKPDSTSHDDVVQDRLLTKTAPASNKLESIDLRFDSEKEKTDIDTKIKGKANIAVVDDDFVIRELVKTVFEDSDWTLNMYEDGKKFSKAVMNTKFDLLFLDLMMPEMNGFQVLEFLKQQQCETPIIVFSANSQKETVIKVMSYGVKMYMTKPLKPDILICKALEVLNANF